MSKLFIWLKILLFSVSIAAHLLYISASELPHPRFKRVINGAPGNIVDYPYLVSISFMISKVFIRLHHCGGCIIAPNIILTAAHCTNYERSVTDTFKVRVGSTYWIKNGAVYDVKKIIQHKKFSDITYENDIAILVLSNSIALTESVKTISLAQRTRLPGAWCMTAGWGVTQADSDKISQNFNVVSLPFISLKECQESYSYLTEGVICAGYPEGGKDACTYDSGGPLIENNELIGIVSRGAGCALPHKPGIYTDIVYMRQWIEKIINKYSA